MTDEEKDRSAEHSGDADWTLRGLSQIGFSLTGAAYVLGVLISNAYLGGLGLPPPELLQSRYLFTGALWLTLTCGTAAMTMWAWSALIQNWRDGGLGNRMLGVLFGGLLPITSLVAFLWLVSNGHLNFGSSQLWISFVLVFGAAIELWIALGAISALRARVRATGVLRTFSIRHYVYQIAMAVMIFLAITVGYGRITYPALDAGIGGGAVGSVLLVPSSDRAAIMRRMHLRERTDGLFGPVDLVAEDATAYYFIDRGSGTLSAKRLAKDACAGVLPSGTQP